MWRSGFDIDAITVASGDDQDASLAAMSQYFGPLNVSHYAKMWFV